MFSRKFKKLLNTPSLFIRDSLINKAPFIYDAYSKLTNKNANKNTVDLNVTVVSACYNVAKYLDKYFKSMVHQTIGFKQHIYLIMVDDGSLDETPSIIKKWAQKYPHNIFYIRQENQGQSVARNNGLNYVTTPWVTFTDPDDFLEINHFKNIARCLNKNVQHDIQFVSTNMIFYYENLNKFVDTHPLKGRFSKGDTVKKTTELGSNIILSSSSSLLKTDILRLNQLKFNGAIKPNFEDGELLSRYILSIPAGSVLFCKNAIYYYRKRSDGTSTLDGAWADKRHFEDVFTYGYIPLLKSCMESNCSKGRKLYIQNVCLYDLYWHVIRNTNNVRTTDFLTNTEKQNYLYYMDTCFSYIDYDTIMRFNLAGCWFKFKLGMINCFKHQDLKQNSSQYVYINKFDEVKNEVEIFYFCAEIEREEFLLNEQEILPTVVKTKKDEFCGRTFILTRRFWLPLFGQASDTLRIAINGIDANISLKSPNGGANKVAKSFTIGEIRLFMYQKRSLFKQNNWLFVDRIMHADDNAEHLYRYVTSKHPEINAKFALSKKSPDYKRLKKVGFNLIPYGSKAYVNALKESGKFISSQLTARFFRPFGLNRNDIDSYIFLQHGVIKDDLSPWVNTQPMVDLFVTTTPQEKKSIDGDFNFYNYTSKEIIMSGLPRHDALLTNAKKTSPDKIILVQPTWRQYLGNGVEGKLPKDEFLNSNFASNWFNFLQSTLLHELCEKYGYRVMFFPHPNTRQYLDCIKLPSFIEDMSNYNSSMQNLFLKASILITDYSSVAFDFALLKKPILYFQFDAAEFWETHTYRQGYFSYEKDGFGAVCENEQDLLKNLTELLKTNATNPSVYLERIHQTFTFGDTNNCERTYNAIKELELPRVQGYQNKDVVIQFVTQAINRENWQLALDYIAFNSKAADKYQIDFSELTQVISFRKLVEEGKLTTAQEYLSETIKNKCEITNEHIENKDLDTVAKQVNAVTKQLLIESQALLFIYQGKNELAQEYIAGCAHDIASLLKAYINIHEPFVLNDYLKGTNIKTDTSLDFSNCIKLANANTNNYALESLPKTDVLNAIDNTLLTSKCILTRLTQEQPLVKLEQAATLKNYNDVIRIGEQLEHSYKDKVIFNAIMSYVGIKTKQWNVDGTYRKRIEAKHGRNHIWRLLAAERANADKRKAYLITVFNNLTNAYPNGICDMTRDIMFNYAKLAFRYNKFEIVKDILMKVQAYINELHLHPNYNHNALATDEFITKLDTYFDGFDFIKYIDFLSNYNSGKNVYAHILKHKNDFNSNNYKILQKVILRLQEQSSEIQDTTEFSECKKIIHEITKRFE